MKVKIIKKFLFTFISIILIGWLCNILAAMIPHSAVHNNITESINVLAAEGPFKAVIGDKYSNSIADNNTDAWMLLMADYDGTESILEKSLGGFYKSYENTSQTGSGAFDLFISSGAPEAIETGVYSYSRYWHGWMLPLKLLLTFSNYEDIRFIGMIFLTALFFTCIYLALQKDLRFFAMAFGISVLFMLPITAMISFEYSFVLYVTLISNIILLNSYETIKNTFTVPVFFLGLGMATSYFDFLTYPPVSLGFCYLTYLFLRMKEADYKPLTALKDFAANALSWGAGYIGMWISKWIIGTLVLHTNVIQDALNQLILRTSQTDGISNISETKITYGQALSNNLEVFATRGYLFIGILFMLLFFYFSVKRRISTGRIRDCITFLPVFMLTAIIPFAWVFILKNHTYLHRNFTSNLFAISVFAFFAFFAYILEEFNKTTLPYSN
ncbi:MAG TPA: hypothetical protein H9909_03025 [Candidatus Mediterraneibacter norfolkensis]|nr:hypothetical protein [Candidatus Mediterraneibacter norfolkensis]